VLDHHPDDLFVVVNLAELYLNTLRIEPAAELLQRALKLDPDMKHPAGVRARVLIMKAKRHAR
jgi:cytochrome c-type biogenesis protein CcmH/NrfG